MIFKTAFDYCSHFLQTLVSFLSCPIGVLFVGLLIALLIVSIFNLMRR